MDETGTSWRDEYFLLRTLGQLRNYNKLRAL